MATVGLGIQPNPSSIEREMNGLAPGQGFLEKDGESSQEWENNWDRVWLIGV